MSRWFRVYNDLLNERKIQKLPSEHFRVLINLWCLASKNDGVLPDVADIAYVLRMSEDETQEIVDDFLSKSLLDKDHGKIVPHNWGNRQYKSDSSAYRMAKLRSKRKQDNEKPKTNT